MRARAWAQLFPGGVSGDSAPARPCWLLLKGPHVPVSQPGCAGGEPPGRASPALRRTEMENRPLMTQGRAEKGPQPGSLWQRPQAVVGVSLPPQTRRHSPALLETNGAGLREQPSPTELSANLEISSVCVSSTAATSHMWRSSN